MMRTVGGCLPTVLLWFLLSPRIRAGAFSLVICKPLSLGRLRSHVWGSHSMLADGRQHLMRDPTFKLLRSRQFGPDSLTSQPPCCPGVDNDSLLSLSSESAWSFAGVRVAKHVAYVLGYAILVGQSTQCSVFEVELLDFIAFSFACRLLFWFPSELIAFAFFVQSPPRSLQHVVQYPSNSHISFMVSFFRQCLQSPGSSAASVLINFIFHSFLSVFDCRIDVLLAGFAQHFRIPFLQGHVTPAVEALVKRFHITTSTAGCGAF